MEILHNNINIHNSRNGLTVYDSLGSIIYNEDKDLYFLYHAKKIGYIKSFNVNFNKREFDTSKGGGTLFGKYILIKRTIKYLFKFIR